MRRKADFTIIIGLKNEICGPVYVEIHADYVKTYSWYEAIGGANK